MLTVIADVAAPSAGNVIDFDFSLHEFTYPYLGTSYYSDQKWEPDLPDDNYGTYGGNAITLGALSGVGIALTVAASMI